MKRLLSLALLLLLAVAAISGCSKSTKPTSPLDTSFTGGATPQDVAAVNSTLAANPGYVNEDQYTTNAQMGMQLGTPGMAIIRPIFWWRTIDSAQRVVSTDFSDPDSLGRPTMAVTTVHRHFVGTFNIFAGDTALADTARRVVRKPLDDDWERKLTFKRTFLDSTGKSHWRLVGTSGVTVTSKNATTQILSVRIQSGTLDTTITDPLAMYRLHRLLWLHDEDSPATVTVTTGRPDDIVVLYHGWERRPFHANGDNTYTATFQDLDFPGLRHFGVNAFSHGTLWDDTAPYDSNAWILAFGVRWGDCEMDDH